MADQNQTYRSNPEYLRAKAALWQKAAHQSPESRDKLMRVAQLAQLAASAGQPQKDQEESA